MVHVNADTIIQSLGVLGFAGLVYHQLREVTKILRDMASSLVLVAERQRMSEIDTVRRKARPPPVPLPLPPPPVPPRAA